MLCETQRVASTPTSTSNSVASRFFAPFRELPDRAGSIKSIALLRGLAVLLVLWDHVVGGWTTSNGRSWVPLEAVRDWVTSPLGIIQDFGFFGVTLFFLLSGYIISAVAVRETRFMFGVKRILRIYPALIVSVLIIVAIEATRGAIDLAHGSIGLGQSLWSMTLVNYVRINQQPVNGVAWSLVVEMAFYVLVFALLGVLKRRPILACGIELLVVLGFIATARSFPIDRFYVNWFLAAATIAYLPLLVMGQAIWLWHTKRASARWAMAIGAASWIVFVFGMRRIHTQFLSPSNSYGVSALFAAVVVLFAVINEDRIRLPRWIAAVSVISYSVYLIHGPLTVLIMDKLAPQMPFTLHLIVALVLLTFVSLLLWRLVEVPAQSLARWLTKSHSVASPTPTNEETVNPGGPGSPVRG